MPQALLSTCRLQAKAMAFALVAVGCLGSWSAALDVIELNSGHTILGRIDTSSPTARTQLTIELKAGGKLVIDRSQVARVASQTPDEAEYEQRARKTPDTAADQWKLAMWCRERKLRDPFRLHLQHVTELDPENEEARQLLGLQEVHGEWLTRDEVMASRGMVRHNGDYRTPQEVEIIKRVEAAKQRNASWKNQLNRWRRDLNDKDPRERQAAAESFMTIDKPAAAAGPLAAMLLSESDPEVLRLLIDAAGRLRQGATAQALVKLSLEHPLREIRFQCIDMLKLTSSNNFAGAYVSNLRSKNNGIINRAATALGELKSPSAVGPLIERLISTHRYQVGAATGNEQNFSFDSRSGATQFGSDKPKFVKRNLRNQAVLDALVAITGENFGYDVPTWRQWLMSQSTDAAIDLRRDE